MPWENNSGGDRGPGVVVQTVGHVAVRGQTSQILTNLSNKCANACAKFCRWRRVVHIGRVCGSANILGAFGFLSGAGR